MDIRLVEPYWVWGEESFLHWTPSHQLCDCWCPCSLNNLLTTGEEFDDIWYLNSAVQCSVPVSPQYHLHSLLLTGRFSFETDNWQVISTQSLLCITCHFNTTYEHFQQPHICYHSCYCPVTCLIVSTLHLQLTVLVSYTYIVSLFSVLTVDSPSLHFNTLQLTVLGFQCLLFSFIFRRLSFCKAEDWIVNIFFGQTNFITIPNFQSW